MTDKKEENLREDIFSVIGGISPKDNEYFYGKDADKLVEIVHHYADSQAKEVDVDHVEKYLRWRKENATTDGYTWKLIESGEIYTNNKLYEIFTKQK